MNRMHKEDMKDAHLVKGSILSYLDLCSNQFCFVLSPYTQQVLNATRMKRHPLLLSSWYAPDHTYRRTEVLNFILGFYISFLGNLFLIYYLRPKFLFTFTHQPNSLNKRNPCFSAALSGGVEGLGFPPCWLPRHLVVLPAIHEPPHWIPPSFHRAVWTLHMEICCL